MASRPSIDSLTDVMKVDSPTRRDGLSVSGNWSAYLPGLIIYLVHLSDSHLFIDLRILESLRSSASNPGVSTSTSRRDPPLLNMYRAMTADSMPCVVEHIPFFTRMLSGWPKLKSK